LRLFLERAELLAEPTERGRLRRYGLTDEEERDCLGGVGESGVDVPVSAVDREVLLVSNERLGRRSTDSIGTAAARCEMSSEGDSLMLRLGWRKGLPPRLSGGSREDLLAANADGEAERKPESYHVWGRDSGTLGWFSR
jgi:hypothetical protein